jgi:dipeptidase
MVKDMQNVQYGLESSFVQKQDSVENAALALLKSDKSKAIQFLTETSVNAGNKVVLNWLELGDFLITKYNDGYIRDEKGRPKEIGYPKEWYKRVINDDPEKYKIKDASKENQVKSL